MQQQQCDANLNFNCSDIMDMDNRNKKHTDPEINDNNNNNLGHYESNGSKFGKMRRNKKTRYKNDTTNRNDNKVRHFTSAICDVIENDGQSLFNCPVCRDILYVPVTLDCGHTYCANCIDKLINNKCCECDSDIISKNSTNVLLQDIVTKWRDLRRDFIEETDINQTTNNRSGNSPRYYLRSTHTVCDKIHCDKPHRNKIFRRIIRREKRRRYLNPYCTDRCEDYFNKKEVCDILKSSGEIIEKNWSHLKVSDFDCILCSQYFLDPVTTGCGHTFCRDCLARVLDHGLACPLCMATLSSSDPTRGTTCVLQRALKIVAPHEYADRLVSTQKDILVLDNDSEMPVFVCTNAFPGVACPLYVYEPRYRLLARRCLQSTSRKFAMVSKSEGENTYATYGTILEVKDAVHLHDGRSILTTVGIRRFRIIERGEQDGYDTAKVQYIRDTVVVPDKVPDLIALQQRVYKKAARWVSSLTPRVLDEVESTIGKMPELEKDWPNLPDGPAWAWWLMPILPLCSQLQVGFLSTTNLEKRLRAIEKMLEHMKIRMRALERNSLAATCTETVDSVDSCRFSGRSIDIPYSNQ